MAPSKQTLINDVEAFLARTGMGESYFGKLAAGNSELVARLRNNRRVWPETEKKIRNFMRSHRVRERGHRHTASPLQGHKKRAV